MLEEGKLHWRYELMVSSCLIFLLRQDVPTAEGVVRYDLGLISFIYTMCVLCEDVVRVL